MENIRELIAALTDADTKTAGTLAERVAGRQTLRAVRDALTADPQGFAMHLDAIEHAFRAGYAAAGGKSTGPEIAQAFADYETKRRGELGL